MIYTEYYLSARLLHTLLLSDSTSYSDPSSALGPFLVFFLSWASTASYCCLHGIYHYDSDEIGFGLDWIDEQWRLMLDC
jgi:hypothetical protein